MKPEDLGLDDAVVSYWDMDDIAVGEPLESWAMKEDLAQAVLRPGLVVDIGWYSDGDAGGSLVVMVVADSDWERPVFREAAGDLRELVGVTKRAVAAALASAGSYKR